MLSEPLFTISILTLTGELGLGQDEPKSATKPTRNIPLVGIDVFEYVLPLVSPLLRPRPFLSSSLPFPLL